jgi:hypothetical protein
MASPARLRRSRLSRPGPLTARPHAPCLTRRRADFCPWRPELMSLKVRLGNKKKPKGWELIEE